MSNVFSSVWGYVQAELNPVTTFYGSCKTDAYFDETYCTEPDKVGAFGLLYVYIAILLLVLLALRLAYVRTRQIARLKSGS